MGEQAVEEQTVVGVVYYGTYDDDITMVSDGLAKWNT
jgi:hypothetical protein